MQGIKYDQDKDRWDLVPWAEFKEVVKVLTYGAKKYKDDNWQNIEDPKKRYLAACQRHITAWIIGEKLDQESTFHHLAHAICCLLFLMWFDSKEAIRK